MAPSGRRTIASLAFAATGPGAAAFAAAVMLTAAAAMQFDPRLIWDDLANREWNLPAGYRGERPDRNSTLPVCPIE
ncbi:hypothetical protein GCM10011400_64080 [Paraburkholderia caffeinilytica]|uniref:Uncharacterized protein n=1 Tax=Paraburkholderia caffeinilytica TaxID=1761016 RepID=A0ABQ1NBD4_9BURK|nr:paraquat-inducible protein A [Paraburkholderia caffeinilytica]GGC67338.1 hypothetical protein GCM10011400_64080 [Paraburkholderia caffeinilytica]